MVLLYIYMMELDDLFGGMLALYVFAHEKVNWLMLDMVRCYSS